mmetsp:Transcript_39216/g.63671  ORF Transcript_39216/g.63671 Transcript_39216/m.63671 type:complete len:408 (-) Transcript_39216:432-1655(-)
MAGMGWLVAQTCLWVAILTAACTGILVVTNEFLLVCVRVLCKDSNMAKHLAQVASVVVVGAAPFGMFGCVVTFKGEPQLALETTVGAGMFAITIIPAACVFLSGYGLDQTMIPLLRDSGFYAVSILCLYLFVQATRVKLIEAGILVGALVVYVVVLLCIGWFSNQLQETTPLIGKKPLRSHRSASFALSSASEISSVPSVEPEVSHIPATRLFSPLSLCYRMWVWVLTFFVSPEKISSPGSCLKVLILSFLLIGGLCERILYATGQIALFAAVEQRLVCMTLVTWGFQSLTLIRAVSMSKNDDGPAAMVLIFSGQVCNMVFGISVPFLGYGILLDGDVFIDSIEKPFVQFAIQALFVFLVFLIILSVSPVVLCQYSFPFIGKLGAIALCLLYILGLVLLSTFSMWRS